MKEKNKNQGILSSEPLRNSKLKLNFLSLSFQQIETYQSTRPRIFGSSQYRESTAINKDFT